MTTQALQQASLPKIASTTGISLQRLTSAAPVLVDQPEVLEPVLVEALKDAPHLLKYLRAASRFAGWAGLAYLLFHSEDAGSFSDEVNPITGQAYSSQEERDAIKALSSSELKSRIAEARRERCEELHSHYDRLSKQLNEDASTGRRRAKCDESMSAEQLQQTLDALKEIEPLRRQFVKSRCDDVLPGSLNKARKGIDSQRGHEDQVYDYQIRIKNCFDLLNTRKGGIKPKSTPTPSRKSLQTKLIVNTPGDKYEQEADRIAEQVMRMPEHQVQRQCACGKSSTEGECSECKKKKQESTVSLQCMASSPTGEIAAPPIVDSVLSSPGSPLPTATRSFMESRFGQDFSHVRVHTDQRAAESAAAVQARAYAVGENIVFGRGESPSRDHRLLAHELTHVLQQVGKQRSVTSDAPSQGATTIDLSSTTDVLQAQFTPYARPDFGQPDSPNFLDQEIVEVKFLRSDHMNPQFQDNRGGDDQGSIKHYVPYNWLMKNIADKLVAGHTRQNAINNLDAVLATLGLQPLFPSNSITCRFEYDSWVANAVYAICDWEGNLFRHSNSSGDARGTRIDSPNNAPALLNALTASSLLLAQHGLVDPPL